MKKYPEELISSLEEKALALRKDVIGMMGVGVSGHIGGAMSAAEMMATLYFQRLRYDPRNPRKEGRDRFLLSKGHAGIIQYACLVEAGILPRSVMSTFKEPDSILQGHPDVLKTPGIEAGTGSLGQGLSVALGMALGQRLNGETSRTYVMMGDGEINEGQIWEAAMAAANFRVDNLVGIVDVNGLQATGFCKDRFDMGDLAAKWAAFGWHVISIDGHDIRAILSALDEAETVKGMPTMILMKTVKGKGIGFAENNPGYHNTTLNADTFEEAMHDLSKGV